MGSVSSAGAAACVGVVVTVEVVVAACVEVVVEVSVGFATTTPLFQTNFFPDLVQV